MNSLKCVEISCLLAIPLGFPHRLPAQGVSDLQHAVQEAIRIAGQGIVEVSAYADDTGAMRALNNDPQVAFGQLLDSQSRDNAPAHASGFFITTNGHIVTAAHAVRHAKYIVVRKPSGLRQHAELLGLDDARDLALLRAEIGDASVLELNTQSRPEVGTFVVALGFPFGLGQAASFGIISASEQGLSARSATRFIQTDAAINSGNSGGPLVGLDGRVMGMQSVVFTPEGVHSGLGFVVPADVIGEVVHRLMSPVRTRPWLGFIPSVLNNIITVAYVVPDSPAERAGLTRGATITHINGREISTLDLLKLRASNLDPGSAVDVGTNHGESIRMVTAARPEYVTFAGAVDPGSRRMDVRPLTPEEEQLLMSAIEGLQCTCSRQLALSECANCSEAKSMFTLARSRVLAGDDKAGIRRYLNAPCHITVWLDYTQNDSRALARCVDGIQRAMGSLVLVQYRHFPASADTVDGWRQCVKAVEVARQYGQATAAHHALVIDKGGDWRVRLARLPEQLLIPKDVFRAALQESRFEKQIWNDLTEGPSLYHVKSSPQLFVDGIHYTGAIDCEPLLHAIEGIVLDATL